MIEVTSSQTQLLRENDRQITQILRKLGYKDVLVSPEPRKPSLQSKVAYYKAAQ